MEYLIIFIIIYLMYLLILIRSKKNKKMYKKSSELTFLKNLYNIEKPTKLLINIIALSNAFIITSTYFVFLQIGYSIIGVIASILYLFLMQITVYIIIGKIIKKKER